MPPPATPPPPPRNGNCATPIDLTSLPSPYTDTTSGAANDDTSTSAPDLIFTYLLPPRSTITLQQITNTYDSFHILRYGGECPGSNTIARVDDSDYTPVTWANTLDSAQTVYYIQSGYSMGAGTFTLSWNVTQYTGTLLPS